MDLSINAKKLNLLKRSNIFLEKTKKQTEKFHQERKLLLDFSMCENVDCELWEKKLIEFENLIN